MCKHLVATGGMESAKDRKEAVVAREEGQREEGRNRLPKWAGPDRSGFASYSKRLVFITLLIMFKV